jgi:hypothetical protein
MSTTATETTDLERLREIDDQLVVMRKRLVDLNVDLQAGIENLNKALSAHVAALRTFTDAAQRTLDRP